MIHDPSILSLTHRKREKKEIIKSKNSIKASVLRVEKKEEEK